MARKPPPTTVQTQNIINEPMGGLLAERYLSYALSTIMSRSLPDVRDGLKPVHRRLLFAMYQLKLSPNLMPKKSARVVGDVIGKFHPHGDQAVYDTLVRLAQDFAVRYPLVDGQGNFGNIDGDNAAAMRYTESRLTETAIYLLEGIDEDANDFRATYDGETLEPIVLPANFPNLLANGASGIAVGMATSIPPHNILELCDAMEKIIDGKASDDDICAVIKGPDFPTGGVIVESKDSMIQSYKTGRGSFRVRAKWTVEKLKGDNWQIVITEIPYQVQKAKLVEKIAELINDKKIPMLDDVRDESAEDIRLVIVPKTKTVEASLLMEALFRSTELESRFPLNMNVLDGGVEPKVMSLIDVLRAWLNHRQDVLIRRSKFRLSAVDHRLEVLAGYLIVYLNIDEVIKIIREADEPKPALIKKFGLTDVQAEAILNMRLRSLRRLEEFEIRKEHDALAKEKTYLEALLKSTTKQWNEIKKQVGDLKKSYEKIPALSARRSQFALPPAPVAIDLQQAMIEKEPITLVCSAKGWIKAMKGHDIVTAEIKYKDGDREKFIVEGQTTDKFIAFATNGRFYTIGGDKLPSGRGFGEPLRLIVDIPNDADIVTLLPYDDAQKFLVIARDGRGFMVPASDCLAQTKNGKQIMNVDDNADAVFCAPVEKSDTHIAIIGQNRKLLAFKLDQIPEMSKGKGVILQKYKDGYFSDAKTFKLKDGLTFTSGTRQMNVPNISEWIGERAQSGKLPPNGFPRSNRF
jgi:topoisomerase-4 subunit A